MAVGVVLIRSRLCREDVVFGVVLVRYAVSGGCCGCLCKAREEQGEQKLMLLFVLVS